MLRKGLHISKDSASGMQVGKFNMQLSQICFKYDKVNIE